MKTLLILLSLYSTNILSYHLDMPRKFIHNSPSGMLARTSKGIFKFDVKTHSTQKVLPYGLHPNWGAVQDMQLFEDLLFVAYDSNLFWFNSVTFEEVGRFSLGSHNCDFRSFYIDTKKIYLSCHEMNIMKYDFIIIDRESNKIDKRLKDTKLVQGIKKLRVKDNIITGTFEHYWFKYDLVKDEYIYIKDFSETNHGEVSDYFEEQNFAYIVTRRALVKLDLKTNEIVNELKHKYSRDRATDVHIDKQGRLLVTTLFRNFLNMNADTFEINEQFGGTRGKYWGSDLFFREGPIIVKNRGYALQFTNNHSISPDSIGVFYKEGDSNRRLDIPLN